MWGINCGIIVNLHKNREILYKQECQMMFNTYIATWHWDVLRSASFPLAIERQELSKCIIALIVRLEAKNVRSCERFFHD